MRQHHDDIAATVHFMSRLQTWNSIIMRLPDRVTLGCPSSCSGQATATACTQSAYHGLSTRGLEALAARLPSSAADSGLGQSRACQAPCDTWTKSGGRYAP